MDEQNSTPHTTAPWWRVLLAPKRLALTAVLLLVVLVLLWGIVSMLAQSTGLGQGSYRGSGEIVSMDSSNYNTARKTVPSAPSYDRVMESDSIMPEPIDGGMGSYDESEYETRQYTSTIKTKKYEETCDTVESWKPLSYMIFEHSNRGDSRCWYRFKVEHEYAAQVVEELEKLDPTNMNEQTEVVKRQLVQYTDELAILQEREALLASTLVDVSAAYDELVELTKDAQDTETLAKAIDGKLRYMQTLSQQRITVAAQLQALVRRSAELSDRVDYVYFDVTVNKREIINSEALKSRWETALQSFVYTASNTVEALSLGLLLLVLQIIQVLVYVGIVFVVVLVVAKVGWRGVRAFWRS